MNKEKILKEITQSIVKSLLQEKLSSRVWHFLPLTAMWSIAEHNGEMHLSRSERDSDVGIFKNLHINDPKKGMSYNGKEIAPYYLSLSRTPSTAMGYVRMRSTRTGKEWSNYLCRIEFDGDMLNQYFKGKAVNYFRDKYESSKKMMDLPDKNGNEKFTVYSITPGQNRLQPKAINGISQHRDDGEFNVKKRGRKPNNPVGYTDYNIIRRNQMHEYEDRLFSYEPNVNLAKFMKRIDIFIGVGFNRIPDEVKYQINAIVNKFKNITHVYNNEASFNLGPTQMGNNNQYQEITADFIKNISGYNGKFIQKINNNQLGVIAEALAPIIYIYSTIGGSTNIIKKRDIIEWLKDIGVFNFYTKNEWNSVSNIFFDKLYEYVNKYSTDDKYCVWVAFVIPTDLENKLLGKLKYIQTNIYEKYIQTTQEVSNQLGIEKEKFNSTNPINGFFKVVRDARKLELSRNNETV